jgi:type II secretion system protein J
MNRLYAQGLSFLELLLAITIFTIVAVGIYSTFGAGLSTWRKTQKAQNLYQDIRLFLDKIEQDLENAVIYSDSERAEYFNFEGEGNKISFFSLVPTFQAIPYHPELKRITYIFDESTHTLQRLEQKFSDFAQGSGSQEAEQIIAQIYNLNFFYCYLDEDAIPPYKWMNNWNSEQDIPQGVKVELEIAAEKLPFAKYIFIPNGRKGKEEE